MATVQKLQTIVNQWSSCADCDDPYPEWADVSRGIIVCLECSGVHRSLGTHVSQIRSLTLDVWQAEWVNNMQESNQVFNELYEYHVAPEYIKPTQYSSRDTRERYIIAKYIGSHAASVELNPLFHRQHQLNINSDPLPPVYDASDGGDDEEESESTRVTKNGTKPWRDYRLEMNKNGRGKHERRNSGMIVNTGVLHIYCQNAVNLPKGNLKSKKSCYCSFDNGNQCANTQIVKRDSKPQWNENLILSVNENECIRIAVYNKNESDMLCYNYFDLKDYPTLMKQEKCAIRDYNLIVAKKYRKNKRYAKDGKQILLNFDIEYNKMSSVSLGKTKRESLILDNTKIITLNEEDEEEEEESITMLNGINQMELIDEEEDDENIDSLDSSASDSSSSPPPSGHPGDTVDTFVSFNHEDDDDDVPQRIRLTASISLNSYLRKEEEEEENALFLDELKRNRENMEYDMKDTEDIDDDEESTRMQSTHIDKLVEFSRGTADYVDIIGLIDSLRIVLRINDVDRCNVVCECIDKLNFYIFDTERDADRKDTGGDDDDEEDEDALNGINDTIIDSLRQLNNELMRNHMICSHLRNIFLNISDDNKYIAKQYLIHNLNIIHEADAAHVASAQLMFKNLLESADADNIEYIFNEILKMNDGDSYKLHDVMDLIVDCINNNNIKVKRLSVEILSKFSRDIVIQKSILEYSNEILRFLYLIDIDAFINISYNIMLSVALNQLHFDIYGVHYNAMQKYIAQQLVDDYDAQQYNDDINPILYAIKLENVDSNCYILSEKKLTNIIAAHLDDVEQYELDYNDMINIGKSKQILNFQTKTQCALIMQNMFRSWHQRNAFLQIVAKKRDTGERNKDLMDEKRQTIEQLTEEKENNLNLNEKLLQQQDEIQELRQMIEKLKSHQQETKMQQMNEIAAKNEEINRYRDENAQNKLKLKQKKEVIAQQKEEIETLKCEHRSDKQQFAIKMDDAMKKLRDELKIIGSNQRKQKVVQIDQIEQENNNNSFFGLW